MLAIRQDKHADVIGHSNKGVRQFAGYKAGHLGQEAPVYALKPSSRKDKIEGMRFDKIEKV